MSPCTSTLYSEDVSNRPLLPWVEHTRSDGLVSCSQCIPSVDVHVCRLVKSSRVLTSTTFFSFPDSILAYHILIVLPYASHPSYRQPYPSTDMICLRFRLSVLTCLSCNVCFPSLPLYSFLFLTSTDRKAKSWWNCCLTLQFSLCSIFFSLSLPRPVSQYFAINFFVLGYFFVYFCMVQYKT